ncbi:MAG: glycosyltransferase family 4 protein [Alphaproteobacteria bacterium]
MSGPVRTLHVDIEGGFGGSSRSLFELIRCLDRERILPLVAHRQQGPVVARYQAIGVPTAHVPEIASYVPRRGKGLRNLIASLPRLARLARAADRLARLARDHGAEVIHLNYEGLFLLAPLLRHRTGLPMVVHCRALLPEDAWGRWVARRLAAVADHLLFISPQEEARVRALARPRTLAGEVMWNIAPEPPARAPLGSPPEAVYLGSLDPAKGADRLVTIAAALDRIGAPPLVIAAYGEARARPRFAAELAAEAARFGHRLRFRGHTAEPETALASALALVRPSREDDPWGRDVIEAARAGVPALATGTDQGVVEHGVTGWLFQPFEAEGFARRLAALAFDPELRDRIGAAAAARAATRFSGGAQAARAASLFERLAGRGETQPAVLEPSPSLVAR